MRLRLRSTWNSHHHRHVDQLLTLLSTLQPRPLDFQEHRNHPHNPLHLQRDTGHRLLTTLHYILPNTQSLQNLSFNTPITTLSHDAYRIRLQGYLHFLLINRHNHLSNL
ncbi:hypothetical protein K443DRAFT_592291 [Laccaria amethystina LaAM-08-1]|uniref:Uncharacterized protein n=1 Tax=Laccaria amethystina LaAM-08-1 TaxID=1095629 RepID=A0A0C9WX93_9AGAR|nr:hypothetical protein K443DRAFT_592291 [Laccaria amethystina LaAM-08-1]